MYKVVVALALLVAVMVEARVSFFDRRLDAIMERVPRIRPHRIRGEKALKRHVSKVMEMGDEELSDVLAFTYTITKNDAPAIYFSQDAYNVATKPSQTLPSAANSGPWRSVLATNVANYWAATKVFTNDKDTVVVAYKGTNNFDTVITDIKSAITTACTINGVSCGSVGRGFYELYQADIAQVSAAVEPLLKKGYKLVLTGHSLGGATSSLGAFYFATKFPQYGKPSLINFASPKVGNQAWVDAFKAKMSGAVVRRFVTKWKNIGITIYDNVTLVPPYLKHIEATEIYVDCLKSNPISCHMIDKYIEGIKAVASL